MGGGVSQNQSMMSDVLSATALVGQAFNAIKFPDLYKIQDFHSSSAKPLKEQKVPPLFAAIFGNGNIFSELQAEINRENGITNGDDDEEGKAEEDKEDEEEEEVSYDRQPNAYVFYFNVWGLVMTVFSRLEWCCIL